jgi:hypothetical protein
MGAPISSIVANLATVPSADFPPNEVAPMTKPTLGAPVIFHPGTDSDDDPDFPAHTTAYAGTIAYVHSDTLVNLGVLDASGDHHSKTSIPLIGAGALAKPHEGLAWCELAAHAKHAGPRTIPAEVDPTAQRTDAPGWKDPKAASI